MGTELRSHACKVISYSSGRPQTPNPPTPTSHAQLAGCILATHIQVYINLALTQSTYKFTGVSLLNCISLKQKSMYLEELHTFG